MSMKCPQYFLSQGVRGKTIAAKNFGVLIWINKIFTLRESMFPIGVSWLFMNKYKDIRLYLRISRRYVLEISMWYDKDRNFDACN